MSDEESLEGVEICGRSGCGRPLSGRGQRSAGGVRYCTDNPLCRAARDRAAYARKREAADVPMETRPCSRCGAAMQPRSRRVTDSPLGRWCQRSGCQEQRRKVTNPDALPKHREAYLAILEIREKLANATVADCSACGFPDGRVGFMHPHPEGESMCLAQGDAYPTKMPEGYEELFGGGDQ